MSVSTRSAETEAEVQALAARLRTALASEAERLARLLLSKEPQDLFGPTEFTVRDQVLRLGAQAYQVYLAEKKTATKGPA